MLALAFLLLWLLSRSPSPPGSTDGDAALIDDMVLHDEVSPGEDDAIGIWGD